METWPFGYKALLAARTIMGYPVAQLASVLDTPHEVRPLKNKETWPYENKGGLTVLNANAAKARITAVFGPIGIGWRVTAAPGMDAALTLAVVPRRETMKSKNGIMEDVRETLAITTETFGADNTKPVSRQIAKSETFKTKPEYTVDVTGVRFEYAIVVEDAIYWIPLSVQGSSHTNAQSRPYAYRGAVTSIVQNALTNLGGIQHINRDDRIGFKQLAKFEKGIPTPLPVPDDTYTFDKFGLTVEALPGDDDEMDAGGTSKGKKKTGAESAAAPDSGTLPLLQQTVRDSDLSWMNEGKRSKFIERFGDQTWNALDNGGRKYVLTQDRAPAELKTLYAQPTDTPV